MKSIITIHPKQKHTVSWYQLFLLNLLGVFLLVRDRTLSRRGGGAEDFCVGHEVF